MFWLEPKHARPSTREVNRIFERLGDGPRPVSELVHCSEGALALRWLRAKGKIHFLKDGRVKRTVRE